MSETKLDHAEESLRQSEEEFQLLIEGMQDAAIYILSPKGYVVAWNSGAERIEGYKTDEIMGKHFSCFFLPEAIVLGEPQRKLLTAIEQGSTEDEGWRVRNDGRQFWAHVVTTALFDKNGVLRGFARLIRDLTERREWIAASVNRHAVGRQDAATSKTLSEPMQHDDAVEGH